MTRNTGLNTILNAIFLHHLFFLGIIKSLGKKWRKDSEVHKRSNRLHEKHLSKAIETSIILAATWVAVVCKI